MAPRVEQVVDRDSIRWIEQQGASLNSSFFRAALEHAMAQAVEDHMRRETEQVRERSRQLAFAVAGSGALVVIIVISAVARVSAATAIACVALGGALGSLALLLAEGPARRGR